MRTVVTASVIVIAAAVGMAAQGSKKSDGVAGSWEMTVKGPAAHGDLTATMELKQEGKKVTGSFTAHGNTHTVAGEFNEGELSLATTDTPADHAITMNARLTDEGTLAGYLSSTMGDMQWTATKVRRGAAVQH